jgi:outer membrane protein assembly factor BamB
MLYGMDVRSTTSLRLLAVLGALALAQRPAQAADSEAMFRGNAAHLGVYESTAPELTTVKWRFHAKARIVSSPAVEGGVVYVGSYDGSVYALREADGSQVWKFATNGPVNSSPAVANATVFASSLDGRIYAIDAQTGNQKWRFTTEGERRFTAPGIHGIAPRNETMPDPFDVFLSSPTVAGGTIYVGSGDHNVYALDAATGALRWKFVTGNVVHASPAVVDGVVYIGSWDRYFYAIDANTGTLRWKYATGDDHTTFNQVGIQGSAAVANGSVYFGARDSHFYALDAKTGELRWKHDEHGSWVVGSPAIFENTVYYTTSDERKFFALDAQTGAPRFSVPYAAFAFSSPSIAGGVAYYGSFDGLLYAVDTRSGRVVGRFATDASRANLAAHLNAKGELDIDAMYPDGTLDGIFVGLSRIYALGSIPGTPAIDAGTLFVGSTDGTLYAIR